MTDHGFYHISQDGKLTKAATLNDVLAAAALNGYIWIDYYQPKREDLTALIEPFGLHELSIEDCMDDNQIPKIENYPRNTFIIFNAFDYTNKKLSVYEINMFIGEKYLITVSGGHNLNAGKPLQGIENIVEMNRENIQQGTAFLAHVILDHIVDQKFIAIEALEDDLDETEEAMLADPTKFNPTYLLSLRRDLLSLRKSLFHEREILVKICRRDSQFISEQAIFHYRDIYDHLAKFFELTETYRDIVTSLMEMYLSMLNNQMAKTSNKMNATVRRLTLITTIFMPLSLLAGIGGMSEWSMMTGPNNWKIAYPLFLLAMFLIGIANYYLLKRLEKKDEAIE